MFSNSLNDTENLTFNYWLFCRICIKNKEPIASKINADVVTIITLMPTEFQFIIIALLLLIGNILQMRFVFKIKLLNNNRRVVENY